MTRMVMAGAVLAAMCAAAAPVSAQTQPRPYTGLWGGGAPAGSGQSLSIRAALGSGFHEDRRTVSPTATPGATQPPRSGGFTNGSAGLNYGVNLAKVRASASVSGSARYYPGQSDPFIGTYAAGANLSTNLGSRTTLSTDHHIGLYEQNLAYYSGAGLGSAPPLEFPIDLELSRSYRSGVSVGHTLSKRIALSGSYSYFSHDLSTVVGQGRYGAQTAQAGMTYALFKGMGLRAGYAYSRGAALSDPTQNRYEGRTIDAGVDFSRPLSLSRRTTIVFSTGFSGVRDQRNNIKYYLVGSAALSYEVGRSWTLSGNYHRTVDFFQLVSQPIFVDSGDGSLGGQIGKRVSLSAGFGVTRGQLVPAANAPAYVAANVNTSLNLAITRSLALSVSYSYYRYQIDRDVALLAGLPLKMDRQGVRASLSFWAPLLSRRANAAR